MSDEGSVLDESVEGKRVVEQNLLKAHAVRAAMFEIVGEQRAEIIRRARAKLVAQGVTLAEDEAFNGETV